MSYYVGKLKKKKKLPEKENLLWEVREITRVLEFLPTMLQAGERGPNGSGQVIVNVEFHCLVNY